MKHLLFSTMLLAGAIGAQAQQITLLTFESYSFPDKFNTDYGYGKIEDGFQWGGGLEFALSDENAIELIYQRLDTDGYVSTFNFGDYRADMSADFIMIGGTRYAPLSDVVSGFGTIDLGMVIVSTDFPDQDNVTKFAWALRGGVRIMPPGSRVSFRLHAQLMSAVQAFGGGLYFGTGGGGAGVSTYSTVYQFNLGGSLNVRLK